MTESVFYNNIYSNKETSPELHFDTVFSSRAHQTETKVNMNAAALLFFPAFPGGPYIPKMKSKGAHPK